MILSGTFFVCAKSFPASVSHPLHFPSLQLTAAIIFISIGVIASFFCAIVDGIIASEFIVSITYCFTPVLKRTKHKQINSPFLFYIHTPNEITQVNREQGVLQVSSGSL